MDHPNIAQVLDAGLANRRRPYFVMELVRGLSITEYCDAQRMGVRQRARLLVTVCRAVQHAHQKGIIHRDIKPSNVIVGDSESGPFPKVIDFGVAKAVDAHELHDTGVTLDGHPVGTPLYMSPEQARLDNSDVDTRTDIYSLGVLFYELMTGSTPIESSRLKEMDLHDLRRVIRKEEVPSPSARLQGLGDQLPQVAKDRRTDPRSLIQSVRGDLDRIVGKAMAKDRAERYPTANGLARDIERYLDHLPIEASPPSTWYRLQRFARRNRAFFAAGLLVASTLLVSSLVSLWQVYQKTVALHLAEVSTARLSELLYVADMRVASDAWKDADSARLSGLLQRHQPIEGEIDHRHFEWYFLSAMVHRESLKIGEAQDDIEAIRFSPDRRWLAVAARDGKIRICDPRSYKLRATLDAGEEAVNDVMFTPDSQQLIAAGDNGALHRWDLATGVSWQKPIPAHQGHVHALAFDFRRNRLISAGDDGRICLWDLPLGQCSAELLGHTREIESLQVSPDGRLLASASSDGTIRLWNLATGQLQRPPISHGPSRVLCVAFSQDGELVAAGDVVGRVKVYPVHGNQPAIVYKQLDGVECITFLPGDQWLATGDRGGSIQFWPVADQDSSLKTDPHGHDTNPRWQACKNRVTGLALTPGGKNLISGSRDGEIRRWSAQLKTHRWSIGGEGKSIDDFACVGSRRQIVVAGAKGLELWDLDLRKPIARWAEEEGPWNVLAVSPQREVIVAGNERGQLVAWQWDALQPIHRWESADAVAWHRIVFGPNGRCFATTAWDKLPEVRVFDLDQPGQTWRVPAIQSKCAAFHPDGNRMAVAWQDDGLLYNWRTERQLGVLRGHSSTLSDLAFSPDGSTLATVGHDRKLRLWETATGKQREVVVAHRDWVRSVAFAPDGWSLVTAGDDCVVRIWHAATAQLLMELPDEGHYITKARFTADGRSVMGLTSDHRLVIYDSLLRRPSAGVR